MQQSSYYKIKKKNQPTNQRSSCSLQVLIAKQTLVATSYSNCLLSASGILNNTLRKTRASEKHYCGKSNYILLIWACSPSLYEADIFDKSCLWLIFWEIKEFSLSWRGLAKPHILITHALVQNYNLPCHICWFTQLSLARRQTSLFSLCQWEYSFQKHWGITTLPK